jgi:hypothetical protein
MKGQNTAALAFTLQNRPTDIATTRIMINKKNNDYNNQDNNQKLDPTLAKIPRTT